MQNCDSLSLTKKKSELTLRREKDQQSIFVKQVCNLNLNFTFEKPDQFFAQIIINISASLIPA